MSKDDATWLNVAYICFGALAAFFCYKALEMFGIQFGWVERFEWFNVVGTLAGIALGILLTLWLKKDGERHEYFLASIGELRKVTWPTWNDTKRMTIIVCVVVGIFAVILSVFDVVWSRALRLLIA